MGNSFEEAKHQGYSQADMLADARETEEQMELLGCRECKYGESYHSCCASIIEQRLEKCPFKKEV